MMKYLFLCLYVCLPIDLMSESDQYCAEKNVQSSQIPGSVVSGGAV